MECVTDPLLPLFPRVNQHNACVWVYGRGNHDDDAPLFIILLWWAGVVNRYLITLKSSPLPPHFSARWETFKGEGWMG
jgi:hypothetical protein